MSRNFVTKTVVPLAAITFLGIFKLTEPTGADAAPAPQPQAFASSWEDGSAAAHNPVDGNVYYARCDDARAAGVAPIRRSEPGYAAHLDRDGDGIACEPYHGR